eukprot:TRINITY_DN43482_c0_g1_i1.p1 TRINITY_DN43482_c0_g1~~TRINITY_DN43482_c0_g1_i1.p1  ORF type:complete len:686 (+),score=181.52 TRINITY_DN43482_c0_g1_i1:66-2123(+)
MCWSFEASVFGGVIAYTGATTALLRNASPRDHWNAIFMFVVGSMQWIDATLWWLEAREGLAACTALNTITTIAANWVIMAEPCSQLLGRHVAGVRASRMEVMVYAVVFVLVPLSAVTRFSNADCARSWSSCSRLTPGRHIIYAPGRDMDGGSKCYRHNIFWGDFQFEIPLLLRVCFLLGMLYPLLWMRPIGSGVIQSLLLTATWLVGYSTDGHASMWCLAASGLGLWLLLDAYIFPDWRNIRRPGVDTVVVGDGVAELTTAALLARAGKDVVVVRHGAAAAGPGHNEAARHILPLRQALLRPLVRGAPEAVLEPPEDISRTVEVGQERFHFEGSGADAVERELTKKFPAEADSIRRFLRRCKEAVRCTVWSCIIGKLPAQTPFRHLLLSSLDSGRHDGQLDAKEVIETELADPRLRAVLCGTVVDWAGGGPASFYSAAASITSMCGGFVRGVTEMTDEITGSLRTHCGEVRPGCAADMLRHTDGSVQGVRLSNGESLYAATVVAPASFGTQKKPASQDLIVTARVQLKPGSHPLHDNEVVSHGGLAVDTSEGRKELGSVVKLCTFSHTRAGGGYCVMATSWRAEDVSQEDWDGPVAAAFIERLQRLIQVKRDCIADVHVNQTPAPVAGHAVPGQAAARRERAPGWHSIDDNNLLPGFWGGLAAGYLTALDVLGPARFARLLISLQ